jgi:hypothetical protein
MTMKKMFKLFKVVTCMTLILSLISGYSYCSQVPKTITTSSEVKPIDMSIFKKSKPTDEDSLRLEAILKNVCKYGVGNWYNEYKNYDAQKTEYITFHVVHKDFIRDPVEMAFGLAVCLKLGIYDEKYTGVSKEEATEKTVKLLKSIAKLHKANCDADTQGAWGDFWLSSSFAFNTGFASWLLWDEFSEKDQNNIKRMVEHEANRDLPVYYFRDKNGTLIRPGDTGAEENSFNGALLGVATAMMPNHPNVNEWRKLLITEMVSAISRPSDTKNETVLHGKMVKEWIDGSNIEENGTLENHGSIHPAYMSFMQNHASIALSYILSGQKAPEASRFNMNVLYRGLVDTFTDPDPDHPTEYPGAYLYTEDDWKIYYPRKVSDDKGTSYISTFANIDTIAGSFDADSLVTRKHSKKGSKLNAAYWVDLHAQRVLDMQKRFDDGHTYLTDENNKSKEHMPVVREVRVAKQMAQSYLIKWLDHQGALAFTNDDYGFSDLKVKPVAKRYEFEADIVAKTTSKGDTCSYIKILRNIPEIKAISNSTFEDFKANAVGDFMEHTIKLEAPGTYNIKVKLKQNNNNGKYQLDIDGANQNSPIDMYLNNFNWTIIDLGNKTFYTPGLKKFRFKVVGKNELSTGYNAQIDYVELVPVNN